MILRKVYVIARTASGRASLQHRLSDGSASRTLCGLVMDGWTRWYGNFRIDPVFCRTCARAEPLHDQQGRHAA